MDNNELHDLVILFEPQTWNIEEVVVPWREGEEKLKKFNTIFNFPVCVNDFRTYVENSLIDKANKIPQTIAKAKNIINTIAISSAEAERGFSKMNQIIVDNRSNLNIQNVSNLLTISLTGLPLNIWDPFVKSWLRQHNSADDTRVKKTKGKYLQFQSRSYLEVP